MVARLPGATDFRWRQVKISVSGPPGNSFNVHHLKFERLSQQTTHVGKVINWEGKNLKNLLGQKCPISWCLAVWVEF